MTDSLELPRVVTSRTSLQAPPEDRAIAQLLSRLAALLGHAVAVHRFGMVELSEDGVDLSDLDRLSRATEQWKARFPQAVIAHVAAADLGPDSFPLLWFSDNQLDARLVRGRLSSGACTAEDADGQTTTLDASALAGGTLLSLRSQELAQAQGSNTPQSATDWFAFALRKHRRIFIEAVFATFLASLIGLMAAMYTMQVYDRVVPTKGFSTLWVLTIGVLLALVLEFVVKQVRAHMVDRASKAIDQELSGVFFGKALDIRMDARPSTVGTFASQIRHFESVRNFMASSTLFILADAPFALVFIGIIGMIAGPVALVPLVMVPLAMLAGLYFRRPIEQLTAKTFVESNRKNGLLIEAIDGIESVKAVGGEWKMRDRYSQLTATIASSELELKDIQTRATNLAHSIMQLNYVGMIVVGAYAISTGSLTTGGLIACSIISGRAVGPLGQIPQLIVQWTHARTALKSLDGIMAKPSDRRADQRLVVPDVCAGHLQLDGAVFGYRQDKPTLEVPSLTIRPGERVAVLGTVGSGKSTLVKMLSGLFKPQSGRVLMDGVDMDQLAPEFIREHIGYLPQDVRLFSGTLRDNLTLGLPTPNDSLILRAARLTGLDQAILGHPKGLELEINEGGRGLSGGQRQLVGLTRLLLAQPRIMLLDEPTASMDGQLEARVMKHLFEDIAPDTSVVVVTHKTALLAHVNRIVLVDKGRIVADGPRDQVLAAIRAAKPVTAVPPANGSTGAAA